MTRTDCFACGGPARPIGILDQMAYRPMIHCSSCGHVGISELPDAETIKRYYHNAYSDQRVAYLGERYRRIMRRRAAAQLNMIAEIAGPIRSLLDIGCGYGHLMQLAQARGIAVHGLEFDTRSVDYCRTAGLWVETVTSETELIHFGAAEACILSHVLEHLREPDRVLCGLYQHCRLMFIEVPAYDLAVREQFAQQEGHLNFFTLESLAAFLARLKLRVLAVGRYGPSQDVFWSTRWGLLRRGLRALTSDSFWYTYNRRHPHGIWIRAIVEGAAWRRP